MCESARAISTNAAAKLPLNGISVEKAPEVGPNRPGKFVLLTACTMRSQG